MDSFLKTNQSYYAGKHPLFAVYLRRTTYRQLLLYPQLKLELSSLLFFAYLVELVYVLVQHKKTREAEGTIEMACASSASETMDNVRSNIPENNQPLPSAIHTTAA
jgi:hypothetical protein